MNIYPHISSCHVFLGTTGWHYSLTLPRNSLTQFLHFLFPLWHWELHSRFVFLQAHLLLLRSPLQLHLVIPCSPNNDSLLAASLSVNFGRPIHPWNTSSRPLSIWSFKRLATPLNLWYTYTQFSTPTLTATQHEACFSFIQQQPQRFQLHILWFYQHR